MNPYNQYYNSHQFDPYTQYDFQQLDVNDPYRQSALERRVSALERQNEQQTRELNRQKREIERQNTEIARLNREIGRINQEIIRLNQNDEKHARQIKRLNQRLRAVENRLNIPFTAGDGDF